MLNQKAGWRLTASGLFYMTVQYDNPEGIGYTIKF